MLTVTPNARCLARCQKDDGSWKPSLKGRLRPGRFISKFALAKCQKWLKMTHECSRAYKKMPHNKTKIIIICGHSR